MHVEDIILRKEWAQLNDAEKQEVSELARDETSFNLLKIILIEAAREEVPLINDEVYQRSLAAFENRSRVLQIKPWYYAVAAAVIALGIAVWLFTIPVERETTIGVTGSIKKD